MVSPIEKKVQAVISSLPADFSVYQFAEAFKRQYPTVWAGILRGFSDKPKVDGGGQARPAELTAYLIRLIRSANQSASRQSTKQDASATPEQDETPDSKARIKLPDRLKAEFNERAREILKRDRERRLAGKTNNTTAEIRRAQEQAYRLGFWDGVNGQSNEDPAGNGVLTWIEIPPRPRKVFEALCRSSWSGSEDISTYRIPRSCALYSQRHGKWYLSHSVPGVLARGVGDQTIKILLRLGLLATGNSRNGPYVIVSYAGWGCWKKYLQENPGAPVLP